jgi:hypothetical protein
MEAEMGGLLVSEVQFTSVFKGMDSSQMVVFKPNFIPYKLRNFRQVTYFRFSAFFSSFMRRW